MYHELKMSSDSVTSDNERLTLDLQLLKNNTNNSNSNGLEVVRGRQLTQVIDNLATRERDLRMIEMQVWFLYLFIYLELPKYKIKHKLITIIFV